MFVKPFSDISKENREKTDIEYSGVVEDNNDPEKLGRVRARIALYEDIPTENLPWAQPKLPYFLGLSLNSIAFSVPEIGSGVCIDFPTKDIYHPAYSHADLSQQNKCTFFDTDYPNSYGWKDSIGNFFITNKVKKTMQIQHSSSSNAMFDENGSVIVTLVDGTVIKADVTTHTVTVDCVNFVVNASGSITLNSPSTNTTGQLADYKDSLDTMRSQHNSHVHPNGDGDTGGPTVQM